MSDPQSNQTELRLEGLLHDVATLREFVEQQGRRDEVQQRAFDQLYAELKQYKEDFVYQAEKPLLLDLLLFYDSLRWFQDSLLKQQINPEVVADSFQYLIDEFLELLYRRDVLPLESRPTYDRETQKAIKTVPATAPGDDNRVHQIVKRGFARGGRVLRPEEVVVAKFAGGGADERGGRE